MVKKTYGEQIYEHRLQYHSREDDVIEYRRAMEPAIMAKVYDVAQQSKSQPLYLNKDFYIVLAFVRDHVSGQDKPLVFARRSCPTPMYKQCVWKVHNMSAALEFMWTIPDAMLYWHIMRNQPKYLEDKETKELAQFVILMESGELLEWVKKENGEKQDAVIRIQPEQDTCLITTPNQ